MLYTAVITILFEMESEAKTIYRYNKVAYCFSIVLVCVSLPFFPLASLLWLNTIENAKWNELGTNVTYSVLNEPGYCRGYSVPTGIMVKYYCYDKLSKQPVTPEYVGYDFCARNNGEIIVSCSKTVFGNPRIRVYGPIVVGETEMILSFIFTFVTGFIGKVLLVWSCVNCCVHGRTAYTLRKKPIDTNKEKDLAERSNKIEVIVVNDKVKSLTI